jgi:hypothetical protein
MGKPIYRPSEIHTGNTKISMPPWTSIAQQIRDMSAFLRQHLGEGQVYTYSGPGRSLPSYDMSPDYDYTEKFGEPVKFAVILHSPPKADGSFLDRQLTGAILPWKVVPKNNSFGFCELPATVKWRHLSDGVTVDRTIFRSAAEWPGNWSDVNGSLPSAKIGVIQLGGYQTGNLFEDGQMEYGVGLWKFWKAGDASAVLKDTVNFHGGIRSLPVTADKGWISGPWILGTEKVMEIGADYAIQGWYRGDGTCYPTVVCGAVTLATGTTSTDWQAFFASFVATDDVIKFTCNGGAGEDQVNFDDVSMLEHGKMAYTPDAGGDFTVGFLTVDRMRVAALSLWTTPDNPTLTDAEAIVTKGQLNEGKAIRGYTGTGVPSIGDLEHAMGTGELDADDVERATRRCLLQSGHPRGLVTTESGAYYNIRGGQESSFLVWPRNLLGKPTGSNVSTVPCLYGYCGGAAEGNEAYVKMTALTSGDSWEYEINSDTEALWTDANRLDIDAAGDSVKIEVKAPPDGYIVIRSYSLWEDSYDV